MHPTCHVTAPQGHRETSQALVISLSQFWPWARDPNGPVLSCCIDGPLSKLRWLGMHDWASVPGLFQSALELQYNHVNHFTIAHVSNSTNMFLRPVPVPALAKNGKITRLDQTLKPYLQLCPTLTHWH